MAEPFVGEIRMFSGTYAPEGWALCDGQLLQISENETLFNLIGTTYGGDGSSRFGLPDLRGRVPFHMGSGGGETYSIGQSGGVEQVTLNGQQLPQHGHSMMASKDPGESSNPAGNVLASPPAVTLFKREAPERAMAPTMVLPVGGNQPHENLMPYLTITYIISLFGIYPSQE